MQNDNPKAVCSLQEGHCPKRGLALTTTAVRGSSKASSSKAEAEFLISKRTANKVVPLTKTPENNYLFALF